VAEWAQHGSLDLKRSSLMAERMVVRNDMRVIVPIEARSAVPP
jgi:hypothetical protein